MTKMISFVRSLCVMAIVSLLAQSVWAALPTPVAHWTNLSEGATGDDAGKFTVKAGTGCTFSNGQAVLAKNSSTATTGLLVEWENGQVPAGSLTVVVKYSGYNSSGLGFNSLLATKWGDTYEEVVYANGGGSNVGLSANVTTSDGGTQNLANPTVAVPAAGYMVVTMSTDGNYGTSVSFRGAANASFSQATYQSGHRYGSQAFKGIKIGGTQSPIGKYHRPEMTIEEVTLYTAKLTADDFNAELPRTASFTVANETDWSTKTLPTTVDTAYALANTSFANNADYKQTLASGEATVVNVTDVSNGAYIYGLHAFEGQNGIGAITRDIYLMVSGGAPAVISGGEDASWNSSTKTIPTGNVLVNITGDTTVDYVYGAGLGGGTGNGLAKIIGNVGIVVDGNAQVKGSLIAGWQSRHNTIPEVTGNTSILIKNVQTHYQDATLSTDNQRCEQGWIAAGGIHKTNGGRSKVGGNASVTVQLGDDATGTFNKHIVAGGIGIGGGDGQNVTGDGTVTITAPNAVVFAKNVVGGGHSTGNNARIGGNTSVTLNGGTYTGAIYAGGDHSAATVGGTATLTITKGDFSKATLNGGTATGAKALSVANAVIDPSKISGFGTVEIKAGTTFALPAGTASGASYALGTLTVDESVLGDQLVSIGTREHKMTVAASGSNLTFTDVASDTSVSITAEKIAELGLAEMAQGAVASFVPNGNNIAANCTFTFPEGVTDYVAWAEGDTQVFLAKKTRSVSIKFSPATANEGVIAKTDTNVGGYPIAGYFWNHSKMYTNTGTGTTEIMKVKDGTGAELADTLVFYYMPNMYDVNKRNVNGRNKQTTGNGKLTYSYFDDSVRLSAPTFPYAVTQSGFEDCSLPQTPAGKLHWEVGIKNIPYQVFDLYIYQASDQDGTISLLPIAVKANEGEWKYFAGDGNGKTIAATATDRWNGAPYCDSETMVEGTNYIRYRLSKAALGLGENDRIESIYLSHPNVSNGRLGLAGIQIVEVENDGYFTRQADTDGMSEEDKNWTAAGSWKNSSGTAINWPTEPGTAYVNINADEVAEITVDGVIEADEVKLTSSSAKDFKFLTKESLATVNTPNENPDYILKAPVDATGFNGQLYLQSRIDGTITLGQNAGITFVSNVEGEETTAYSYNFIGAANITKVGPGSFLVPESMYTVPFAISAGSLRYDYSGATAATMTRGLSGAGKVVKTGSGEIVMNAGGTFTGGTTINGGTITLGANNALGAQGANVTVNAGGTLDINGKENHGINLTLAGGTLKNSSTAGGGLGQVHLKSMTVTADSVLNLTGRTGILNNGWDATTLTLNDKKLTKTGTGEFLLCNTTVSSGTIRMVEGGIRSSGRNAQYTNGASNLTAVDFEIAGTGITFAGFSPTIKSLTFEDNGSIVAAEDNDATITVTGTVSGTGTANKLTLGEGATVDGSISVTGALAFGNTLKVKAALGETVFTLGEGVAAPATMPAVTIVDAEGEHTGYTLKADGTALKVYAAAKVGDQVYATIESAISAAGDTGVVTIIDAAATIPSTHAKVTTGDVVTLRAIGGKVYYKSGDWTDGCTVWANAAHTSTTTFDVTDTMVFTAAASVYPDHGMTSALKIEIAANTTVNIGHEGAGDWTNLPSGSTIELGDGASVVFQYWGNDAIQGTAKLGDVTINGANGTFSYNGARTNPPTFGAVTGTAKLVLGDGQSVTATSFETTPISGVEHKHVVTTTVEGGTQYSLAIDQFTVAIPAITGAVAKVNDVEVSGSVTVDYGTTVTIVYEPTTGYQIGETTSVPVGPVEANVTEVDVSAITVSKIQVTITIPSIDNTTVAVTGGTPEGNTVTVDYGTVITVTYTPATNYDGGGTITMTAEANTTLPTTDIIVPTLRTPGEVTATSFSFNEFKVGDKVVTLMKGDTVVVPANCAGDEWHPNLQGALGYPIKILKSMNWKTAIENMTIGKDVKVHLWWPAVIPEGAHVKGDGILVVGDSAAVTGPAQIDTTIYFGEYNTANTTLALTDGATLTVAEKLAEGKIVSGVESKKVVFNEATKTYSLVSMITITIPTIANTTVAATVNGETVEITNGSITVDYGADVVVTYTPDTNYVGGGTITMTATTDTTVDATDKAATARMAGEITATSFSFDQFKIGDTIVTPIDGDTIVVPSNCSGDAWHPSYPNTLNGHTIKILKSMNWKVAVGHIIIGSDVKCFLWDRASIPDGALVEGDGILVIGDDMTVSGNATINSTIYFGEYNTANTVLKLADNATLTVAEALAAGKVTSAVESKQVVSVTNDDGTVTYSLETKKFSITLHPINRAALYYKIGDADYVEYTEPVLVPCGETLYYKYVIEDGYVFSYDGVNQTVIELRAETITSDYEAPWPNPNRIYQRYYDITLKQVAHTTVTVDGETVTGSTFTAEYGSTPTIVYKADEGYLIREFQDLNKEFTFTLKPVTAYVAAKTVGENLSSVRESYTYSIPTFENATIKATIDGEEVDVSSGSIDVGYGKILLVTYTANDGYVMTSTEQSKTFTIQSGVTTDGTINGIKIKKIVASVGDVYYTTLNDAIKRDTEEEAFTIKLLADITEDVEIRTQLVNNSAAITLDLNGKTVTGSSYVISFRRECHFTIIDSSEEQNGKLTCSGSSTIILGSSASLTLKSGTIENTGSTDSHAIYTYTDFEMTGGSIVSSVDGIIASGGQVKMSGGIISAKRYGIWVTDTNGSNVATAEITGGTIENGVVLVGVGYAKITGGEVVAKFEQRTTGLLLAGTDEKYIEQAQASIAVYQDDELVGYGGNPDGTTIYESNGFQLPFNKIKLLRDIETGEHGQYYRYIKIAKSLIFDFNEHSVKVHDCCAFVIDGSSRQQIDVTFRGNGSVYHNNFSDYECWMDPGHGFRWDAISTVFLIGSYADVTIEDGIYVNYIELNPDYYYETDKFKIYSSIFYLSFNATQSTVYIKGGDYGSPHAIKTYRSEPLSDIGSFFKVSGGTFYRGFNPAEFYLGSQRSNVVTNGHISVPNATLDTFTVKKAATVRIPTAPLGTTVKVVVEGKTITPANDGTITVAEDANVVVTYSAAEGYYMPQSVVTSFVACSPEEIKVPEEGAAIIIPAEPKATVTTLTKEGLDSAYTFTMDANEPEATSDYYSDWEADFVVTFDKDVAAGSLKLSGQYDGNGHEWADLTIGDVAAGTEIKLISMVAAQLGIEDLKVPYSMIRDKVRVFNCGVKNLLGNVDTKMTVSLVLSKGDKSLVIGTPVTYTLPVPEIDVEVTPSIDGIAVTIPAIADKVVIESEDGVFAEGVKTIPSETGVYTVTAKKGDVVLASDTIAVVNAKSVTSEKSTIAVAVPFTGATVANLLNTALLTEDDMLMAYLDGSYKSWKLTAEKTWTPATTVKSGEQIDVPQAENAALQRGSAVWVMTAGKVVVLGKYNEKTDIVEPTEEETHLLANPTMKPYTPSVNDGDSNDQVVEIGTDAPVRYTKKSIGGTVKWTKKAKIWDADWGMYIDGDEEVAPSIPVGKGFWFIKK